MVPRYGQRERLEDTINNNFTSLGMGPMETGMAWFWSDARVKCWFDVFGLQHLQQASRHGSGVVVIGIHFMSLELGGRTMGLCQSMMAMCRPHNNKVMELIQTWGRMRSNKAMLDKNLRGMVHALKQGEMVWFAPDQDYGPRGSIFATFFDVPQAATTHGAHTLVRLAHPQLRDYPQDDEMAATCYMNRIVEDSTRAGSISLAASPFQNPTAWRAVAVCVNMLPGQLIALSRGQGGLSRFLNYPNTAGL